MRPSNVWIFSAVLLTAAGCKEQELDTDEQSDEGEKGSSCDPEAAEDGDAGTCAEGLSCEDVSGSEDHVCAVPVEIRGMVIDALDESAIEGAHVTAFDATGAPASDVAITDGDGNYSLTVPVPRDEEGEPVNDATWTLGAAADAYQPYPFGIRPSIPVSIVDAVFEEGAGDGGTGEAGDDAEEGGGDAPPEPGVVENAATTIALIPLPDGEANGVTISGTVVGEAGAGTLVVAEGVDPVRSTIADHSGVYTLFNVPPGSATVRGYRAGLAVEPASVEVADADLEGVDLSEGSGSLAGVSGSVNIVNAPGGAETSVVLVPASVFNEPLERGPVPFGLRSPLPGTAPDVSGGWTIADVPEGTYTVLAAFENDDLVRDPDESIAGTQIVEIEVAGSDLDVGESFKVTEALAVISPGADAPELISGTPTFIWDDDSSEDGYEVVVYDALGNLVWERLDVPSVMGNNDVEVVYEGPALTPGMIYQFRGTSVKDGTRISRTEDLRGVFEVAE